MGEQKFHINSDTNEVGKCSAKIRCRFGGDSGMDNHFETKEEAQKQVERQFEKKFDTLQGARKNPEDASSDRKMFEALDKIEDNEKALLKKNEELRKSIEQELKKNVSLINDHKKEREKIVLDLLEKEGTDALLNVDKARIVYNAHWDNGNGSREVGNKLTELFKNTPYSLQGIANHLVTDDYSKSVSQFRVGIPKGAEEDKLVQLRDSIENVFQVQREVMKDTDTEVTIDVFDDSLSEYGDRYEIAYNDKDKTYELRNRGYSVTNRTHKDLKDVFKEVEKNASYGATEEYEAKNPGWDDKDEDYWAY